MKNKQLLLLTVLGFMTGLLFPAIALPLLLLKEGLPFSLQGYLLIHTRYPNLWVIDLAPFVLSLFLAFTEEKKAQHFSESAEQQLVQTMAGTSVIVSVICFISFFFPGNEEINLVIALPVVFFGAFLGSLLYLYQPSYLAGVGYYLGGAISAIFIAFLMYGTGGVKSNYFFLLLIVLFFGIAFQGIKGFVLNASYVTLGLLSPLLYTPSAAFYFEYLLTIAPIFFLMGFVFLQAFEIQKREQALTESYKKLMAAEKKAAIVTLAKTAAHEIFNRLTPLTAYAAMLNKLSPADPKFHAAIQEIQTQSEEITAIVVSMNRLDPENIVTFGGVEIYDLHGQAQKAEHGSSASI